jgi:hypothetical protein
MDDSLLSSLLQHIHQVNPLLAQIKAVNTKLTKVCTISTRASLQIICTPKGLLRNEKHKRRIVTVQDR